MSESGKENASSTDEFVPLNIGHSDESGDYEKTTFTAFKKMGERVKKHIFC